MSETGGHPSESEEQRRRMLETPVPPLVCRLAVPTICSMLVTSAYNTADTYFVSQIGASASGAVGIVFSIMAIIQAVGFTIGVGAASIASRLLGQGRQQEADTYASSAVASAVTSGVLLSLLGFFRLDGLIWLLGSTETIYPFARQYAFFILLGAPLMILSFVLNNLLRWQGRANLAVIGLTTGGVLNIFLDPLFIFKFRLGIAGAGAATLLSQSVSTAILISFFVTGKSDLRVSLHSVSRSPRIYFAILKQGLPSLFRQGIMSVSTMAINFNARVYGDAAVAAIAIVNKVFMLIHSITIGFGHGFQPVLGYNYGAGRNDRVMEAVSFSLKICTSILAAAALLCFLFAPQIITVFRRSDPDVITIGARAMRFQCFTLPLSAVLTFSNMLFQALGKFWRAILLAVCRQGLCIPLVFLFSRLWGLTGLELTQACADLISGLLAALIMGLFFRREFGKESGPGTE